MSAHEKALVVVEMEERGRGRRGRLREQGIPKSTYYRWRKCQVQTRSEGQSGSQRQPWNHLRPEEELVVLSMARELPSWRSRQLAAYLTDHRGLAVSASTVYRILRREGLVKQVELQLLV